MADRDRKGNGSGDAPGQDGPTRLAAERHWYELFSRGARDWLRHNQKVRDSVRDQLSTLVTGSDLLTRPDGTRSVRVPVKLMEHARFRLRDEKEQSGVGQGEVDEGDVLQQPARPGQGEAGSEGGSGEGELEFVVELQVDDIVDWLWEELALPDLKPRRSESLSEDQYRKEGWGKTGPRALLDRRRTMREAIKRRATREDAPPFTNEDLRYRQLTQRRSPSTNAVVALVLDVSASMDESRRQLAKAFFFWALQGLRRRYRHLQTVFVAHTNEAWEFSEEEFFSVRATGGTVSSTAFRKVEEILEDRFPVSKYNQYVFYASDGDNFGDDQDAAREVLMRLCETVNFIGFIETPNNHLEQGKSPMGRVFRSLKSLDLPVNSFTLHGNKDLLAAIKELFRGQAEEHAHD